MKKPYSALTAAALLPRKQKARRATEIINIIL